MNFVLEPTEITFVLVQSQPMACPIDFEIVESCKTILEVFSINIPMMFKLV